VRPERLATQGAKTFVEQGLLDENKVSALPLRRQLAAGNCAPGVDREISSSSAVMSAGTLANSGVLR
jgi:hypothetical protein